MLSYFSSTPTGSLLPRGPHPIPMPYFPVCVLFGGSLHIPGHRYDAVYCNFGNSAAATSLKTMSSCPPESLSCH